MYVKINTRNGGVLILSKIVKEIMPLIEKTTRSLNYQKSDEDLLCWLCAIFDEDFEDDYGHFSQEYLEKFTLCVLNARHYLITDKEKFCEDFNNEGLDLEIGFDKAFYPVGIGCWYNELEFIIEASL